MKHLSTYGAIPKPVFSRELVSLISSGKVYDLSQPMKAGAPAWRTHPPFFMTLCNRHEEADPARRPATSANEIISLCSHSVTHIDGLAHFGELRDGEVMLYGDTRSLDVERNDGFSRLGIGECPPIIARGVLLDIPAFKGIDVLPDKYAITAEDLQGCAEWEGVEVGAGDCVLLRTGFTRYWSQKERFLDNSPGPEGRTAGWLIAKRISLTGSDTVAYEHNPFKGELHIALIRQKGILIMELLNLDELARDRVYEFLFIALPLKIEGATGSPISPIAVA